MTSAEAARRLAAEGVNSLADAQLHPLRDVIGNFWAPVPWLLEAAIILPVVLHRYTQATIVFGLLMFNAVLRYFQPRRAQATLRAL